jgi:hypothetical protein
MEDHMHKRYALGLGLLAVAAALTKELRKPVAERRWHDWVLGVLPYDFRQPSWARVQQTVWDVQSDQIVVPQVFGIGWTINVGGLVRRLGLGGVR